MKTRAGIAGYHVYRKRSGAKFERLTEQVLARTTYSDETVRRHVLCVCGYRGDKYGNESQPSKEQESFAERVR